MRSALFSLLVPAHPVLVSAGLLRDPGPDAPSQADVAHRKDAPAIRHSSRGRKRLALGAAVTEDSKETALEYFRQDMHAQSSGGPRQSLLKTLGLPCTMRGSDVREKVTMPHDHSR